MTSKWIAVRIGELRQEAERYRKLARKPSTAKDRAVTRARMRAYALWCADLADELYRIQEATLPLLAAGQALSNVAFNLSQPLWVLDDAGRESLRDGCKQWDAARTKAREEAGIG